MAAVTADQAVSTPTSLCSAWRGDGCCVGAPLDGYEIGDLCPDDCCR